MLLRVLLALGLGGVAAVLTVGVIRIGRLWVARRAVRVATVLAITLGVSNILMIDPAFATAYSSDVDTYRASYECAHAHIYINNTGASPYLSAYGGAVNTQWVNGQWNGCLDSDPLNLGQYQIRTREDLYAWSPYGAQWYACNYGPFVYNGQINSSVSTHWYSVSPCGNKTWYFDSGYGGLYNAQWLGGWTQTANAVYVSA